MHAQEPATPKFTYARPASTRQPLYERTQLKPTASRRVIAEDAQSDSSEHLYSSRSGLKIPSDIPKFDSALVGNYSDAPTMELAKRMIPDDIFQQIAREDQTQLTETLRQIINGDSNLLSSLTHTVLHYYEPSAFLDNVFIEPSAEGKPDIDGTHGSDCGHLYQ